MPSLSRLELVKKIMWSRGGGTGLGGVAESAMWNMQRRSLRKPDWISVVAVIGDPSRYTDEELAKILEFSDKVTKRYDRIFRERMGANLYLLRKDPDGKWMRKRLSWDRGLLYSKSLDEALQALAPELFRANEEK